MNSNLTFPIPAAALQEFLPHRPPMVWISHVLSSTETEGVCEVTVDLHQLPFSNQGLRQSSLIEWMAQGFGFSQAAISTQGSSRAYLAALRDIEYCDEETWTQTTRALKTGDRIFVQVKIQKTLPPITLAQGEVRTESGVLLAKGSFKVFVEPQTS